MSSNDESNVHSVDATSTPAPSALSPEAAYVLEFARDNEVRMLQKLAAEILKLAGEM